VVKAQIHAGGRGKGRFKEDPGGKGGVRVVKSVEEVATAAEAMLGKTLVTKQTGERASRSPASTSRMAATSRASSTSAC
jgi:succinyl-CoA synthetase beta subunit